MKQKEYEKPTMKVVKLQHQTQLLQASVQGLRQSYGTTSVEDGTEQEWD